MYTIELKNVTKDLVVPTKEHKKPTRNRQKHSIYFLFFINFGDITKNRDQKNKQQKNWVLSNYKGVVAWFFCPFNSLRKNYYFLFI